jgi:hypothetical protein
VKFCIFFENFLIIPEPRFAHSEKIVNYQLISVSLRQNYKRTRIMATITLEYDSRNRQAEKLIEFIRSLRFVKVKKAEAEEEEFNLYESLDRALADVRLMMDGKKRKKTLDEFLEEIRREKNEVQHSNV